RPHPATARLHALSLHDALPISQCGCHSVTTIGFSSWIALSSSASMAVSEELFSDMVPSPPPPLSSPEELPAPHALATMVTAANRLVSPANFRLVVNTPTSLLWLTLRV